MLKVLNSKGRSVYDYSLAINGPFSMIVGTDIGIEILMKIDAPNLIISNIISSSSQTK